MTVTGCCLHQAHRQLTVRGPRGKNRSGWLEEPDRERESFAERPPRVQNPSVRASVRARANQETWRAVRCSPTSGNAPRNFTGANTWWVFSQRRCGNLRCKSNSSCRDKLRAACSHLLSHRHKPGRCCSGIRGILRCRQRVPYHGAVSYMRTKSRARAVRKMSKMFSWANSGRPHFGAPGKCRFSEAEGQRAVDFVSGLELLAIQVLHHGQGR